MLADAAKIRLVAGINRPLHSMERMVSEMEHRFSRRHDRHHGHGYDNNSTNMLFPLLWNKPLA